MKDRIKRFSAQLWRHRLAAFLTVHFILATAALWVYSDGFSWNPVLFAKFSDQNIAREILTILHAPYGNLMVIEWMLFANVRPRPGSLLFTPWFRWTFGTLLCGLIWYLFLWLLWRLIQFVRKLAL